MPLNIENPDSIYDKVCTRCLKWCHREDGSMVTPTWYPYFLRPIMLPRMSSDSAPLVFICDPCQITRKLRFSALLATLMALIMVIVILEYFNLV